MKGMLQSQKRFLPVLEKIDMKVLHYHEKNVKLGLHQKLKTFQHLFEVPVKRDGFEVKTCSG